MQTLGNLTKYTGPLAIIVLLLVWSMSASAGKEYGSAGANSKATQPAKSFATGKLDGKIYVVQLMETGKSPVSDSLIFQSGRFESTACKSYGFGEAAYQFKQMGNSETFEAKTVSAKEGTMLWKGSIRDNHIQGTVAQTKPGQTKPVEYTFSGTVLSTNAMTQAHPK